MALKRSSLLPGEEVVATMRLHWKPIVFPILSAAIAVSLATALFMGLGKLPQWLQIAVAVLAALVFLRALVIYLRWRQDTISVTTARFLRLQGVLGRSVASVQLENIAEVHARQRLFDRLIGSGDLVIEVHQAEALLVSGVRRPKLLQRLVLATMAAPFDAQPLTAPGDLEPQEFGEREFEFYEAAPSPVVLPPPWAERTPPRGIPATPHHTPTTAALEELDLAWRRGLITDAEYQEKRRRIVDRL